MFCSNKGTHVIDNYEIILKILHLTMQSHEKCYDNIVHDCFSEPIAYDYVLNHSKENTITRRGIEKPNSESSTKIGILLYLEAIGIGYQVIFNFLFKIKFGRTKKINVESYPLNLSRSKSSASFLLC